MHKIIFYLCIKQTINECGEKIFKIFSISVGTDSQVLSYNSLYLLFPFGLWNKTYHPNDNINIVDGINEQALLTIRQFAQIAL